MSYKNFVPTVWAEGILRDRDEVTVAAKLCNRDYEGEIKNKGDRVKINGVSRPSISRYDDIAGLREMERLDDQSTMLEITEQDSFHFYVGDIDERQAKGDIMSEERREAGAALAQSLDSFIYSNIIKKPSAGGGTGLSEITSLTASNVMSTITNGLKALWTNNVPRNEKISLECSPSFVEKLLLAKILLDTDNSSHISSGAVGTLKTFNCDVYMTNNMPVNGNGDYLVLRTKKAVTMAEQINKVEAYRPEKHFGDAVKGLQVFGAKVIRPKECIWIPIKAYGTESNI